LAVAIFASLLGCHPRPPTSQVHRALAGVDNTQLSAAGAPADEAAFGREAPAAYRLTGIVKAGGKRKAMLEDETGAGLVVERGDRVGEYRVDAVGASHVELSRRPPGSAKRQRLRLVIE
jgi:hypothetical protein